MGLFDRIRGNDDLRVAFFGIDGVPHQLVLDNPSTFPNLHAIADAGTAGSISSIVPPESSACWPSLTTGVNPGKTGVYGFQDRENGTYDTYVPMGRDVQATRIWDRVHSAKRSATVMNVPVTFPPQRNIQRMVSGFLSPSVNKAAYPDGFATDLEQQGYVIDVNAKLGHQDDKTDFIDDANNTLTARYNAFSKYIQQNDWDLFFGVFMTTDRVNHFLFKDYEQDGTYKSDFLDFYKTVDDYLGALRDELPDDVTMIIASDHGFTTLEYEVHFNEWLRQESLLSYQTDDHEELEDIADDTIAYSLIPGRFYLNLENREPRGTVPESEYHETRDDLKTRLENMTGPGGEPVCNRVVEKETTFSGEHDDIAPDLVAIPTDGFDLKAGFKLTDEVFDIGPRNGMHTFDDATLYIDDPDRTITDVDLLDIAPTILSIMNIDYDTETLDGQPIT